MTEQNFNYYDTGKGIVKAWTRGVEVDGNTMSQAFNIANMPFVHKHMALMPDAHLGKGATVGSVIATKGAIIPAAVGVDIGCGMMAWQLSLKASDLPDNLHAIRMGIEAAVPHGRTNDGGVGDRGAWGNLPGYHGEVWNSLSARYDAIIEKHPLAKARNTANHLGTLGTGNHFIELCLDEDGQVWIMLHSGSRGVGNKIGDYFINKAKAEMEKYHITPYLPDKDLAYLVEHTELFDDYMNALEWAQEFAWENRKLMMTAVLGSLTNHGLPDFHVTEHAVNCHHNYVAREHHFGTNVLVTRKGAVRAREGDLGIIPGSMGTGSFIVRGKGNAESFCSCSHGAGRRMSRTQAKKEITLEQHAAATAGIECRKDIDVVDESPAAYKDIGAVIAAQSDLIEVVYRLKQIVNVKG
jgi:tRNA-splicing ligase RtcB